MKSKFVLIKNAVFYFIVLVILSGYVLISCNGEDEPKVPPVYWDVTFISNGGMPPLGDMTGVLNGTTIPEPKPFTHNENSNLEDRMYIFKGWFSDNTFNNKWDFSKDKVTKHTNLFARWVIDVGPMAGNWTVAGNASSVVEIDPDTGYFKMITTPPLQSVQGTVAARTGVYNADTNMVTGRVTVDRSMISNDGINWGNGMGQVSYFYSVDITSNVLKIWDGYGPHVLQNPGDGNIIKFVDINDQVGVFHVVEPETDYTLKIWARGGNMGISILSGVDRFSVYNIASVENCGGTLLGEFFNWQPPASTWTMREFKISIPEDDTLLLFGIRNWDFATRAEIGKMELYRGHDSAITGENLWINPYFLSDGVTTSVAHNVDNGHVTMNQISYGAWYQIHWKTFLTVVTGDSVHPGLITSQTLVGNLSDFGTFAK